MMVARPFYLRRLNFHDLGKESTFLWGARQTGKSINYPISYWRTTSQIEVDFILGENEVTIETKSTSMVNPRHLKGLKSFAEEYKVKKSINVSTDPYPRQIDNIIVLPWQVFLKMLWGGEIIGR